MAIKAAGITTHGIDQVDTTKREALGTVIDLGTVAYVYVQGVASGATNALATYTTAGVTTLLAANAKGMVCIFQSTLDATTKFGWALIKNLKGDANASTDTVAANTVPYIDGTAGRIDDAVVAGDKVYNMIITSADTSNVATVWCNFPYVTDESN